MSLPDQITAGVNALRAGKPADAVVVLAPVWADVGLAAAADLVDVRARVGSLYVQALVDAGDLTTADRVCRDVLRLVRKLGDKPGLELVRGLQDRVVKGLVLQAEQVARQVEQRRVADTPLHVLLADATDARTRAERLVKKATAHADVGEHDTGRPLAHAGLTEATAAGDVHWTVLARLALARLEPDHAADHLIAAHTTASDADEFNLVSTVARAAEVAGVALPRHPGPHGALT